MTSGGSERNRSTMKMISQFERPDDRAAQQRQHQARAQAGDDDQERELDRDHHAGQDVRQVLRHDLRVEEGL